MRVISCINLLSIILEIQLIHLSKCLKKFHPYSIRPFWPVILTKGKMSHSAIHTMSYLFCKQVQDSEKCCAGHISW